MRHRCGDGSPAWIAALAVATIVAACGGSGGPPACDPPPASGTAIAAGDRLALHDGWSIRSSSDAAGDGPTISTACYSADGWTAATVPSTVVGAQVAAGQFGDPFEGKNLRGLPGVSYPYGLDFANFRMPDDSPYASSWWYRTDFVLAPPSDARTRTWLHFDGIDYRANVWLNGKLVASSTDVAGMYRRYAFDVTDVARPGRHNVLAVEVFGPDVIDLAHSFVDHAPMPPDKSMGIWQDVYLRSTGPVEIQHPAVVADLAPSLDAAKLTVLVDLFNSTAAPVSGTLSGTIGPVAITESIDLAPNEKRSVALDASAHPELALASPKLWWPYQLGAPNLYDASLDFAVDGAVSDHATTKFGVRRIDFEMKDGKWEKYTINGVPVPVRGAGYEHDMFFRWDDARDDTDVRLVKDMGLNSVRFEGGLARDHFYDVADREGVLLIAGWQCCDAWEHWGQWIDESRGIAKASLESQMLRLRGHPSLLTWWNGSDHVAPPDVEQMYLDVENATRWPNPKQGSVGNDVSTITGPSGAKMNGPYDYVPPVYWYVDTQYGGAFGFNGETGPGPAIPNVESLKKFLPPDHMWPKDEYWTYHAGGTPFDNFDAFDDAMKGRYGAPTSVDDYATKAQALAYDGERGMFEAYRRNRDEATGVVQWMLNNAWPGLIWHLYDYYFAAGGGYYGTKKANEPVHVQYSYDDGTVVVVNDSAQSYPGMKVTIAAYDFALAQKASQTVTVDAPRASSTVAWKLPDLSGITTTYFVKLTLADSSGAPVSDNFYWLSTKLDVLDFANTRFALTPTKSHADLTMLSTLPQVKPTVTATVQDQGSRKSVHVHLEHTGSALAFLVRLRVTRGSGGDEVLPSTWSDDYVSILPGEKRDLVATFDASALGSAAPVVAVSGWNVAPFEVKP